MNDLFLGMIHIYTYSIPDVKERGILFGACALGYNSEYFMYRLNRSSGFSTYKTKNKNLSLFFDARELEVDLHLILPHFFKNLLVPLPSKYSENINSVTKMLITLYHSSLITMTIEVPHVTPTKCFTDSSKPL